MKMLKLIVFSIISSLVAAAITLIVLFSYNRVETLEYANVDFEWVDDFGNYEVVIPYQNRNLYLTVKEKYVNFIYANEDFLNFVVVDHTTRIVDRKDNYNIKKFYINLNYKEIEND